MRKEVGLFNSHEHSQSVDPLPGVTCNPERKFDVGQEAIKLWILPSLHSTYLLTERDALPLEIVPRMRGRMRTRTDGRTDS